jgi:O-antigen/teichoic acid export membrane protein
MNLQLGWSKKIFFRLSNLKDKHHALRKWIEKLEYILTNKFLIGFFKNVGMIFVVKIFTQAINTAMYIVAARELGPVKIGEFAIINTIAGFLAIPLAMGINISMNKFLPAMAEKKQEEAISTTLLSIVPISLFFIVIYFIFSDMVCRLLNISNWLLLNSIFLCILTAYYIISESFLRGQKKYVQICITKSSFIILFTASLLIQFYIMGRRTLNSYLITNYLAFTLFIALSLVLTGVKRFSFNKKTAAVVYSYGFINMLCGGLSVFLTSSDLYFVKSFCDPYQTGIYSVYTGNTRNLFGLFFYEIFSVVFLPTIAAMDKKVIYKKITKYCLPLFSILFLAGFLWASFNILMYGKEYEFNLLYIILASLTLGVMTIYQLFSFTIAMGGADETRFNLLAVVIPLPLIIFTQYILTKLMGITGAFISNILVNLILLFTLLLLVHRLWARQKRNSCE